jgi:thiaminase/transcriptional activator TenA
MSQSTIEKPSTHLAELAAPIVDQIMAHPYLRELQAGTLPLETFRFYVQQDWLYLQERVRGLAVMAGRCPDPKVGKILFERVERLVNLDNHFHKQHAAALDLDFDHITWKMNHANLAYTNHQFAAAYGGSTIEAVAAMLPCPCVYLEVGKQLIKGPQPTNSIYADWIKFYGDGRQDEAVAEFVEVYDYLAAATDPATLARCEDIYLASTRYEWWFWDAAYKRETWPV